MKKVFVGSVILFSFITSLLVFNSCKNTTESKLVYTENNTIKQNVKEKEQDITWTLELEGERLTQTINRNSLELGKDVVFNKEVYKISKDMQKPVYPCLDEFGSLDTSNLKVSVKRKMNDFCTAFGSENHAGAEGYFSRKYIFNYVFFLQAFEDGWKNCFQNDKSKNPAFTKWMFGEPFNGSDIIQIPVRFYADCGTIDMTVFLNSKGNNEIYQITIDRWQKV